LSGWSEGREFGWGSKYESRSKRNVTNSVVIRLTDCLARDQLVARLLALGSADESVLVALTTGVDELVAPLSGGVEVPAIELGLARTWVFLQRTNCSEIFFLPF